MALIDGKCQMGPLAKACASDYADRVSMRITERPEAHGTCDWGCGTVLSDYACSETWIFFQALCGCFGVGECMRNCVLRSSPQMITSGC